MKYIQAMLLKAEEYKRSRRKLAENLKKVDEDYSSEIASLEQDRIKTVSGIEGRRDSNTKTVESQTAKWISDYALPVSLIAGMASAIPITSWLA